MRCSRRRRVAVAARPLSRSLKRRGGRRPGVRVLGADTVVVLDGRSSASQEMRPMRSRCSRAFGARTRVVTGLALREADGAEEAAFVATEVRFARWPAAALTAYVATAHPLDKAGAYGIRGGRGVRPSTWMAVSSTSWACRSSACGGCSASRAHNP
jgi:septum formation protein